MAKAKKKKAVMGRPRTKAPGNPFDREVGRRIKERRKAVGMTDQALAEKIGFSFSQVFRFQSGETRIAAGTLASIAGALGCKASDFVDGIPVPK